MLLLLLFTAAEIKFMRWNTKHKWKGYKRNQEILEALKTESTPTKILDEKVEFDTFKECREKHSSS
jgi:hypothetical protein